MEKEQEDEFEAESFGDPEDDAGTCQEFYKQKEEVVLENFGVEEGEGE